jgi:hypothetical protein
MIIRQEKDRLIYRKGLALLIMGGMLSACWRSRNAAGGIQSKYKVLTTRGINPSPRAEGWCPPAQADRQEGTCLPSVLSLFYSAWVMPTHAGEGHPHHWAHWSHPEMHARSQPEQCLICLIWAPVVRSSPVGSTITHHTKPSQMRNKSLAPTPPTVPPPIFCHPSRHYVFHFNFLYCNLHRTT